MVVMLQRFEAGVYGVAIRPDAGGFEQTPIRVVRKRSTRTSEAWGNHHGATVVENWWMVEFDPTMRLGETEEWKKRIPDWEMRFGWEYSDGFDTLADARRELEEALNGGTREVDAEAAPVRERGDGGGGA